MPRQPTGRPSSRPAKEVDWEKVDKFLMHGWLGTEIAAEFDMHADTFYRKVEETKGMGFTAYSAQKRSRGDGYIRSTQFNKAISGDNTMLIWLGRNRLGQTDKLDKETKDFIQDQVYQAIKEINGEFSAKVEGDSGISTACQPIVEDEQSLLDQG